MYYRTFEIKRFLTRNKIPLLTIFSMSPAQLHFNVSERVLFRLKRNSLLISVTFGRSESAAANVAKSLQGIHNQPRSEIVWLSSQSTIYHHSTACDLITVMDVAHYLAITTKWQNSHNNIIMMVAISLSCGRDDIQPATATARPFSSSSVALAGFLVEIKSKTGNEFWYLVVAMM